MNKPINSSVQNAVFSDSEQMTLRRSNGHDAPNHALAHGYEYDRGEGQGSHLRDYWRVVRKRLWLIIGITVLIPTLVAIYLIRKPDVYEAQARIQVDLENTNPLLGGMSKNSNVILSNETNDPAYFNTQLQILTGPGLLRRIAKNLDLEHNPDFLGSHGSKDKSFWSTIRIALGLIPKTASKSSTPDVLPTTSATSANAQDLAEAERLADYVDELQSTLIVEPVKESRLTVRETRLIDITYRHTDPRLAAKIVNTVADGFVLQNLDKKTETSSTTGTYLTKRIAELQSAIRAKEEELINYAKNHQILSLDANQNTVVERLEGLNKQLLVAENERKLAESAYRASLQPGAAEALAEGGTAESVPSATRVTTEAELKLAELKQRRAELLVENTEKWPAVKEIDKQIAMREKQMNDTRARATNVVTTNLGTRYRQALATEQALRKAYDQQRAETLTQNEAAVNYRIIQQEIETNKTLLDGLLQRTKENEVVMAGTPNNIRVVDYAIAQKKPVAPKRTLIVGLSILLSLGCGVGLAFFIEYLDDSIRSSEDVEDILHLPSVAIIPNHGVEKRKRLRASAAKDGALATSNGNGARKDLLLTEIDKRSPLAEAYRHLRTSILLSTAGRAPRTLLITSSVPSEGKTTTAVNSAISLSQTGAKVLIIDADMRRPRLHGIFNLSNSNGLSALLSREAVDSEISEAIQHDQESGLFVLTAGPLPPNPAELIGSEQMVKLLSTLTPKFTHVIVDSPPVAAFTDGVLIASMVDGVLLVVHSGKSSRKVVTRARKLLQDVGARIIGVVLNRADTGSHSDYYYNSYYSHYQYSPEITESPQVSA
jgi:capsular exopolysaccharide synthesis family protein